MNARNALKDVEGLMACHVDFNDDTTHFCVALEDGFALFKSDTCELHTREELPGSVGFATMLGSSQIIGFISGGHRPEHDSRRLTLYDLSKHTAVATIKTVQPIVRARLSSTHIAIIFERSVSLYKHQGSIEKISTFETASNPVGLGCLGRKRMVLPGRSPGQLQLVDLSSQNVQIVPAHSSTLRAIELSPNEELVASASDKGTLIRLHSTLTTARLAELRRGIQPAVILSLAISPSNDRLAVTSDTQTLHIFDLPTSSRPSQQQSSNANRASRSPTPEPSASQQPQNKWGSLGRLPFAPRIFSDSYSLCSTTFTMGSSSSDTELRSSGGEFERNAKGRYSMQHEEDFVDIMPGVPGGAPPKGLAAWTDDNTVVVINAGRDGLYERFGLREDGTGGVKVVREGWTRITSALQ